MKKITSAFICLLLAVPCQARIIFVDANTPDNNDGSSWAKAYKYLQDALADANSTGDVNQIRVAQGIYTPDSNSADPNGSGDRYATFQLINGVAVRGGFAGFSQPDPNARDIELYETILSGDLLDNDDPCTSVEDMLDDPCRADNCYHLFYHPEGTDLNATAILDGFTITAGNANDSGQHRHGGGMYNYNSSPMLTNCVFSGNSAVRGGGMWNDNSSPTITNCTFSDNSAGGYGGGMYNYYSSPMITNCTFSNNSAKTNGGGMYNNYSSLTVTNCTFSGNSAEHYGGGMHNCNDSSQMITNCTFNENSAGSYGGGITCDDGSSLTITSCIISANSAGGGGGIVCFKYTSLIITNCIISANFAVHSGGIVCYMCIISEITNCIITGNSVVKGGGGISCFGRGPTAITNCTVTGNATGEYGGGISCYGSNPIITNCILFGNTAEMDGNQIALYISDYPSAPKVSYSDVEGGLAAVYIDPNCSVTWGSGNIDADPCFIEPGYWADVNDPNIIVEPNDPNAVWLDGDYHLLPTSLCIDTGDPNYIPEPNETDLDGNPRINDGRIDMGAYEANYIEVSMKFTPPNLNCKSKGKFVRAHIALPEGFTPEDVALDTPALAYPMNLESEYLEVFLNDYGSVELLITFDRQAFCDSLTETGQAEVTIIGSLITGQYFYATATITVKP